MKHSVIILPPKNHDKSLERAAYSLSVNGQSLLERLCYALNKDFPKFIIAINIEMICNPLIDTNKLNIIYSDQEVLTTWEALAWGLGNVSSDFDYVTIVESDILLSEKTALEYLNVKSDKKVITDDSNEKNHIGVITLPTTVLKKITLGENFTHAAQSFSKTLMDYIRGDFVILETNKENADKITCAADYRRILTQFNFSYIPCDKKTTLSLIDGNVFYRYVGVYDVLGGQIAQRVGFDGLWLGSYQISLANGLADDSSYDPNIALSLANQLKQQLVRLPVIIDIGSGFESIESLQKFTEHIHKTNIVAVCIDDNNGKRVNSLVSGVERKYLSTEQFVERIAVIRSVLPESIQVIARTEMLTIDKHLLDFNALKARYVELQKLGINAFLPHYVGDDFGFIKNVLMHLDRTIPIVLIPTGLTEVHRQRFYELNVKLIIYANLDIRSRFETNFNLYLKLVSDSSLDIQNKLSLSTPDFIWNMIDSIRES
jgi:2-methylisocitrate lyase-like PEP mutase family enzyme